MIRCLFLAVVLIAGCDTVPDDPTVISTETVDRSPPIEKMDAHPSPSQLRWQQGEMYMFIHFGMNTFTGEEWGSGTAPESLFFPTDFRPSQWASVAKEIGFDGVIFTAKHHDGFALWPTQTTSYSIKNSPWKDGKGDVLSEVAEAVKAEGLRFGVYLSPWDKHEPSWGTTPYNEFFLDQLAETLSMHDDLFEFWLDGANDEMENPPYDFYRFYKIIYDHHPNALIFGGADIRWVGNELAQGGTTQWSESEPGRWFPVECDVPNRPGWFWRESENDKVKPALELLQIYYTSVGRNCVLLLNVPPDSRGLFHENDVRELRLFREMVNTIFGTNFLNGAVASATSSRDDDIGWAAQNAIDNKPESFWAAAELSRSGWLDIQLKQPSFFNVVSLQEPIEFGQRVKSFRIEGLDLETKKWIVIAEGTTIGYKRIISIPSFYTDQVRLVIESAKGSPAISEFGLHFDTFSEAVPPLRNSRSR